MIFGRRKYSIRASMFRADVLARSLPFHCQIKLNSNLRLNFIAVREIDTHKPRIVEARDIQNLEINVLPREISSLRVG